MLGLNNLLKLSHAVVAQFLHVDKSFSFLLDHGDELVLSSHRSASGVLEVFDRILIGMESMGHGNPFGSLNESVSFPHYLVLVGHESQIDIDVISSKSR